MRRLWCGVTVAMLAGVLATSATTTEAAHLKEQPKKHKIVYHLNEPSVDKAKFVLGNIQNHINGVGGLDSIEGIELVVHGPALKNFVKATMDPEIRQVLDRLQTQGVQFGACGNTMKAFSLTLDQLPSGAQHLPQGGVVRIMELQERGYIYIRP